MDQLELIKTIRPIRFVNVGEDPPNPLPGSNWIGRRQWDGCIEYGFISAGQKPIYSKPLKKLLLGDIVAAYLTGKGYVGIGKVIQLAIPISKFKCKEQLLNELPLIEKTLFENSEDNNQNTEYAVGIEWIKTINRSDALWESNTGLYASRSTQCSLKSSQRQFFS